MAAVLTTLLLAVLSLSSALPVEDGDLKSVMASFGDIETININNIETVLNMLIKSGESVRNVILKFSDISNKDVLDDLMTEAEVIIKRMQVGVSEINQQHKTYAGEALKEMIIIKMQLKNSRTSLNDLAKRTVYAVADLRAFSEAVFEDDTDEIENLANVVDLRTSEKMEYVKEQLTVMKNLIKDTNTKVDEVKQIYADIKVRMAKVEENLVQYKITVEHLLKNETASGGNYAHNARAGVYSTAGVSTTACIVADILGALGICSLINGAVVAGSAITLEVSLANLRASLSMLQKDGEEALEDVQFLMVSQDEIEAYLYKEEEILVYWVAALDVVERRLSSPDRLFLQTLPVVRERYLSSLDELTKAAQDYLDQEEL